MACPRPLIRFDRQQKLCAFGSQRHHLPPYSRVVTTTETEVLASKESKTRTLAKRLYKRYIGLLPLDFWLVTVLLSAVLIFFVSRIWIVIATGGYVLPKDAADWGSWGTWIGGLATAAAFIYTALQIREQRANRIADEAKAFNALKIKSRLVVPRLNGVGRSGRFVGHPTSNPNENSRFNLVFRKSSDDLVLTWVKFTDSAGFTWYRDLKSDEIIYVPQDAN